MHGVKSCKGNILTQKDRGKSLEGKGKTGNHKATLDIDKENPHPTCAIKRGFCHQKFSTKERDQKMDE